MRKGRRERIEKGSRERTEKGSRGFLQAYRFKKCHGVKQNAKICAR